MQLRGYVATTVATMALWKSSQVAYNWCGFCPLGNFAHFFKKNHLSVFRVVLDEVHRGPLRGDAPRDDAPVPVQGQVGLHVVAALTQVHQGQEALGGTDRLALSVKRKTRKGSLYFFCGVEYSHIFLTN